MGFALSRYVLHVSTKAKFCDIRNLFGTSCLHFMLLLQPDAPTYIYIISLCNGQDKETFSLGVWKTNLSVILIVIFLENFQIKPTE